MIKTGIPTLDENLKGGIPIGKTLTYYIEQAASGGDVFIMQTVFANLVENGVCYYVTTNCAPDVARSSFREYGWELSQYDSHFAIVDGYSALIGGVSGEQFVIDDPGSLKSVDRTIRRIINTLSPGDVVAFSSLSSILDNCRNSQVTDLDIIECVRAWNKMAVLNGGVMVYSFTDRGYDRTLTEQIKDGMCNASVVVSSSGRRQFFGDHFRLNKCDWENPPDWPTLFKVIKPGGIWVYIPKILVTGPRGSGKSTFVRTASLLSSGKSVSVDRGGTTVALDYTHLSLRGFSIDLFGTPGQTRFNPIVRTLAKDAMGVILLVDATDPKTLDRASDIQKIACSKTTPYIVAANKQDSHDALEPDVIRKKMSLPSSIIVAGTCALDPASVLQVLETLIGRIVEARL